MPEVPSPGRVLPDSLPSTSAIQLPKSNEYSNNKLAHKKPERTIRVGWIQMISAQV